MRFKRQSVSNFFSVCINIFHHLNPLPRVVDDDDAAAADV